MPFILYVIIPPPCTPLHAATYPSPVRAPANPLRSLYAAGSACGWLRLPLRRDIVNFSTNTSFTHYNSFNLVYFNQLRINNYTTVEFGTGDSWATREELMVSAPVQKHPGLETPLS